MSYQIVGQCSVCGSAIYTYPTYPVGWKKIHTNCLCFEVSDYCFTEYYASLEQFSANSDEEEGIDDDS